MGQPGIESGPGRESDSLLSSVCLLALSSRLMTLAREHSRFNSTCYTHRHTHTLRNRYRTRPRSRPRCGKKGGKRGEAREGD